MMVPRAGHFFHIDCFDPDTATCPVCVAAWVSQKQEHHKLLREECKAGHDKDGEEAAVAEEEGEEDAAPATETAWARKPAADQIAEVDGDIADLLALDVSMCGVAAAAAAAAAESAAKQAEAAAAAAAEALPGLRVAVLPKTVLRKRRRQKKAGWNLSPDEQCFFARPASGEELPPLPFQLLVRRGEGAVRLVPKDNAYDGAYLLASQAQVTLLDDWQERTGFFHPEIEKTTKLYRVPSTALQELAEKKVGLISGCGGPPC